MDAEESGAEPEQPIHEENAELSEDEEPPRDYSWIDRYRDVPEFENVGYLGEGSNGFVYRSKDLVKKRIVAIKRLQPGMNFTGDEVLELTMLRICNHENIMKLVDVALDKKEIDREGNYVDAYMIMDCCEWNLHQLADHLHLTIAHIKCIMEQVFKGLEYLHLKSIVHRDISSANLLIASDGCVKIADFGLAKVLKNSSLIKTEEPKAEAVEEKKNSDPNNMVIPEYNLLKIFPDPNGSPLWGTLWYQSPETLMLQGIKSTAIDMWAIGCVFAELLDGKPLFPGRGQYHQLRSIFDMLGTPTDITWPGVSEFRVLSNYTYKSQRESHLKDRFPMLSETGLQLMKGLLCVNPDDRMTASASITADYFKEEPLPCERKELVPGRKRSKRASTRAQSRSHSQAGSSCA